MMLVKLNTPQSHQQRQTAHHKMKKGIITVGILGAMVAGTLYFGGQTETQIRQTVDQYEQAYFQQNGTYAQFTCGKQKPTDQTANWGDVFQDKVSNPDYDVCIDVWERNGEQGYTVKIIDLVATTDSATTTNQ